MTELEQIHALFAAQNYAELYQVQTAALENMLMIHGAEEFDEFLRIGGILDESIFLFYYSAEQRESLLIGGYEGNVTAKVSEFLETKLPEPVFDRIKESIQNLYVDLDEQDHLGESVDCWNRQLADTGYSIRLDFEELYCAGAYFLSVEQG